MSKHPFSAGYRLRNTFSQLLDFAVRLARWQSLPLCVVDRPITNREISALRQVRSERLGGQKNRPKATTISSQRRWTHDKRAIANHRARLAVNGSLSSHAVGSILRK
jgi:hypothetical protein